MQALSDNTSKIAEWLQQHPKDERVIYPGLDSHPQKDLAAKQMSGFGGMVSFDVGGGLERARKFLENTRIFALAESLGGVESMVNHRSEEHTSELQSRGHLVCRLLLEQKK